MLLNKSKTRSLVPYGSYHQLFFFGTFHTFLTSICPNYVILCIFRKSRSKYVFGSRKFGSDDTFWLHVVAHFRLVWDEPHQHRLTQFWSLFRWVHCIMVSAFVRLDSGGPTVWHMGISWDRDLNSFESEAPEFLFTSCRKEMWRDVGFIPRIFHETLQLAPQMFYITTQN